MVINIIVGILEVGFDEFCALFWDELVLLNLGVDFCHAPKKWYNARVRVSKRARAKS